MCTHSCVALKREGDGRKGMGVRLSTRPRDKMKESKKSINLETNARLRDRLTARRRGRFEDIERNLPRNPVIKPFSLPHMLFLIGLIPCELKRISFFCTRTRESL